MKNYLIQARTIVAGEDSEDAIKRFAEKLRENPDDISNIHWNTVPLAGQSAIEDPVKDKKQGKEYGLTVSNTDAN